MLYKRGGVELGDQAVGILAAKDMSRVSRAQRKDQPIVKKARKEQRHAKKAQLDAFRPASDYSSGQFMSLKQSAPTRLCRTCGAPRKGHKRQKCVKSVI